MTPFKSGSGDLDFGSATDDESEESGDETADGSEADSSDTDRRGTEDDSATDESKSEATVEYPYFIRRSNVTDERDKRLEIHLRPEISRQEAAFRRELADELETETVPKTDAREFALKFAFQHPDRVAELMRDEGFGAFD